MTVILSSAKRNSLESAEMFEVGIVAGDEFSTFLKVEQVQLDMGPSVEDFPAELESRRNACLKGVSI